MAGAVEQEPALSEAFQLPLERQLEIERKLRKVKARAEALHPDSVIDFLVDTWCNWLYEREVVARTMEGEGIQLVVVPTEWERENA